MKTFKKNFFKVLFLSLLSVSLMINTGCEEEDTTDPMVGTWELYEVDMTYLGQTTSFTPAQMEISISVVIRDDNSYTATIVESGINDIEVGTWERVDDSTVKITSSESEITTLVKDGSDYVVIDTEEGVELKMKFKKV